MTQIISEKEKQNEKSFLFEAIVSWEDAKSGIAGRDYSIYNAGTSTEARIVSIKYQIEDATNQHISSKEIEKGKQTVCNLATAIDCFSKNSILLSQQEFTLYDKTTGIKVGSGKPTHYLRRAQNIQIHPLAISNEQRERLNGHKAKVIWFTGLSGSGKSTIANQLEQLLYAQGKHSYILDGDNIRHGLNKDLGFTDSDRVENIRRIAEVAKIMLDAGLIVITSFISPFRQERDMARTLIGEGRFIEVYVNTPLEVCEERDPKGLYKKARLGQLPNMTGIGSPYEVPTSPEYTVSTSNTLEHEIFFSMILNDLD